MKENMENLKINFTNLTVQSNLQNDIVFTFLCPLIGLFGLALNVISIIIISNFKEPMFFYLRVELFLICSDLLVTVFKPVYYCRTCPISASFIANLYYLIFNVYMASVFELGAIMCRNMSALICFLLISKQLRQVRFVLKKSYCKVKELIT